MSNLDSTLTKLDSYLPTPKNENIYAALKEEEELHGLKQDREERKRFADKIFILLCCFLACSLYIVVLSGLGKCFDFFSLSDSVLITLLATTTANVIGIFIYVAKYLYKANLICPHCNGRKI